MSTASVDLALPQKQQVCLECEKSLSMSEFYQFKCDDLVLESKPLTTIKIPGYSKACIRCTAIFYKTYKKFPRRPRKSKTLSIVDACNFVASKIELPPAPVTPIMASPPRDTKSEGGGTRKYPDHLPPGYLMFKSEADPSNPSGPPSFEIEYGPPDPSELRGPEAKFNLPPPSDFVSLETAKIKKVIVCDDTHIDKIEDLLTKPKAVFVGPESAIQKYFENLTGYK